MKFVVKESLERPLGGFAPRAQARLVHRGWTVSHSSFPGNDLAEAEQAARTTESYEETPDLVRDLPFFAVCRVRRRTAHYGRQGNTEARAPHAGRALSPARRAMTTRAMAFCRLGRPLQLQVVVPALTRT